MLNCTNVKLKSDSDTMIVRLQRISVTSPLPQTNLGSVQEELAEALNNKNPSVKAETLLFLCRCYQQCTPAMVPKPFIKAMAPLTVQVDLHCSMCTLFS